MERADLDLVSIPNAVRVAARKFGTQDALVGEDFSRSFLELEKDMFEAVRATMAAGIQPGDRVAIWAPNSPEWIIAALGALGAGAILVPLNTRFKGREAAYVLRKTQASMLFVAQGFLDNDYISELREVDPALSVHNKTVVLGGTGPANTWSWEGFLSGSRDIEHAEAVTRVESVSSESISDIMFTSGTTGHPKGVVLTHGQSLRVYGWLGSIFTFEAGDRYLIIPPFFHTFGYKAGWLACIIFGMAAIPQPVFTPSEVLERIETDQVSILLGPPTLYWDLINQPNRRDKDLRSLRVAVPSATIVPVELIHSLRDELRFDVVLTAYGLTEATSLVSSCRPDDDPEVIANSVGRPADDIEVMLINNDDLRVSVGEPGEILVRGYNVMQGYWEDPEATAAVIDANGWLHTGDIGVQNEDNYLRIVDRKKDIFIVGGFNVAPAEIEAVLRHHPDIADVAVVGIPDRRMGEIGVAFVVPKNDTTIDPDELIDWSRVQLANFKVPRQIFITDGLPRNSSMKVLKKELQAMAIEAINDQ